MQIHVRGIEYNNTFQMRKLNFEASTTTKCNSISLDKFEVPKTQSRLISLCNADVA